MEQLHCRVGASVATRSFVRGADHTTDPVRLMQVLKLRRSVAVKRLCHVFSVGVDVWKEASHS
jgi:hypothetical protein